MARGLINDVASSAEGNPAPALRGASGKRLRVLHVSSGNLYGGVETLLVTLAQQRHLCLEMEPCFGLSYEGRLSRELSATGVPVYALGEVRIRRPWTVLSARRRLRELLHRETFDIVICHMAWTQAVFGPAVRSKQIPLVFYLHGQTEGRHWLERWAGMAATPDLMLCVSRDTSRNAHLIYSTAPCEVIYSPIPVIASGQSREERSQVRAELETKEDAAVIILVSRMEAGKGHSALLEALGRLEKKSDWVCWIVGGAQAPAEVAYADALGIQAARLGVADRVRFLGQRADVPRLLAAADIYCQPNERGEGFGIVFVEAFLASLPVVTTAIGGALEIVDDSCGVLVPWHDLEALTKALHSLIVNPDLRAALGRAGCERVHRQGDPETQLRKLHGMLATAAKRDLVSRESANLG